MKVKMICEFCGKEFYTTSANLKRGYGFCCSKSCAAKIRERKKKTWDPETVAYNNYKRKHWNDRY